MLSRIWSSISRAETALHFSRSRSASVDLPWSMCAMMEKFRMFFSFIAVAPVCCRQGDAARQMARLSVLPSGKTLPQGEFISPEDVQSKGFPQGLQPLWENDLPWLKGSPKSQRLLGERKGSGVSELWLLSLSEGYGTCLDERDDGKISDVLFVHSCCSCLLSARRRRAPNGASKRFAAGEILISCRAGNWSFLRCCGVPASRSA